MTPTFELLDGSEIHALEARIAGERVVVEPASLERSLGWKLEPQGLCRGPVCVPVRDRAALVRDGGIDLAAVAAALGRPLALDADERAGALGTGAEERRAALASLEAPDFTLPDLAGQRHTLSGYRGKKVLLIAYASW